MMFDSAESVPKTTTADAPDDGPIAVGITGHRPRRIEGYDMDALSGRIDETFAALERSAGGARFRLIGSLAEGADTIVAEVALARGWQVDAVLPFDRTEYARDFEGPGTADCLHSLIDRAKNVFELGGSRHESGGEAAAYERAGRVMLSQCELLIAVWDGDPPLGRGGAAQIVVEAIGQGLPILTIHPDAARLPVLMWSGLNEHQLGPEAIDTIARGSLGDVPRLFGPVGPLRRVDAELIAERRRSRTPRLFGIAYPLLLAVTAVRPLRLADFRAPQPSVMMAAIDHDSTFKERVEEQLAPAFEQADREASDSAQLFRGAFVANFALAALAVTLSLLGLIASYGFKTSLVLAEFIAIASILLITRVGARVGWHQRWLDQRRLAERLRCLGISAELGDLSLNTIGRDIGGASFQLRGIARRLELPSVRVTPAYVAAAHGHLVALLTDQISYLQREALRMHHLEHRLHRVGGVLFATTAIICAVVLAGTALHVMLPTHLAEIFEHHPLGVTVVSASLPAIGAAIYGIRMQGDFAGVAERNGALAEQLIGLRRLAQDETPDFDGLRRLVRRTTELLIEDVSQWFRASLARPLSLPG